MFCPNCAAQNNDDQHYCRTCGLKLDAIARQVADQFPSPEYAALARRKRVFEAMGIFSLSVAGLVGLMLLITKVFYYKLLLFGADALFMGAGVGIAVLGLLSILFFSYPRIFMNFEKLDQAGDGETLNTAKLIEDRMFEPASVTEHTTELLKQKK